MLIELLKNKGRASTEDIAKALVGYDKSQVEYYEHITKNMVGKVLTNSRGITQSSQTVMNDLIGEVSKYRGWGGRDVVLYKPSSTILSRAKFRCELGRLDHISKQRWF